jgi:hypothetical protein
MLMMKSTEKTMMVAMMKAAFINECHPHVATPRGNTCWIFPHRCGVVADSA